MPAIAPENRRMFLSIGTVLATLLYTVDSTIVNVALPHMQGSLQATQDQISWVITSYIVVSAIGTPLAGWLGARHGLRRVLAVSVLGFTVVSMLCGLATGLDEMVALRALQGAFGASLVPLSQVALLQEFPRESHGRVMALWTVGVLIGPIMGPTFGGWLTDSLSWRWAFFINAPIGAVALLGVFEGLPRDHVDHSRPFDWTGFILLSLTLAMFQLMLDRGQTHDWFQSTEIVAEAFFAAVFCYMFIVHSATAPHPFVDPSLFRDRNFLAAVGVMFMIGLSIMSPSVLLPSFLQELQGYSPTQAGTLLAVRGLASILAVLLAARLIGRIDLRIIVGAGIVMAAVSLWQMASFSLDTPAHLVALASFVAGFGSPFTFVPLSIAAYATLEADQRSEAGAMLTLMRSIGSSVGISMVVALLARSTQVNQSYLTEHFTAYSSDKWQAVGTVPGANVGSAELVGEITRQAAAIGYTNAFYFLAVMTILSLPLAFVIRAQKAPPSAPTDLAEAAGP